MIPQPLPERVDSSGLDAIENAKLALEALRALIGSVTDLQLVPRDGMASLLGLVLHELTDGEERQREAIAAGEASHRETLQLLGHYRARYHAPGEKRRADRIMRRDLRRHLAEIQQEESAA